MLTLKDEMAEKGVPKIEKYPVCEHRFKVENLDDGTEWCWICGEMLKEPE